MRISIHPSMFACLMMLASSYCVHALPASNYLSSLTLAKLQAGEDVRAATTGKDASMTLAPEHPAAAELIRAVTAENPDVIVEALFLWKKPRRASMEAELLAVYNILRSVGSLQGIEYYSASRGRMRLFYEYSSRIVSPEDPGPVADALLAALPALPETLYARQKDLSFGDNVYRVAMYAGSDFIIQESRNLTTMKYAFFPVAGPEDLHVRLLVISADDMLVFYAVSSAKAALIPGVRTKLEASFGNRAEAVYSWFANQATRQWPATQ